ncbi:MAG: hypothetical protein IJT59_07420 [Desulfovibrionaceae bacterium]|nr:hypothetical protein [Desulfovibrionaceae bacterium]
MWKILFITVLLLLSQPNSASSQPHYQNAMLTPPWETIETWIGTLSDEKRLAARLKVAAHKNNITNLQATLRQKLAELRTLRYDSRSSPETLPRLGLELQEIRKKLLLEYDALTKGLNQTIGSSPKLVLSTPSH